MSKEITSKTKRLTQILALLEQDSVNVLEVSLQLGVSIRTIQRDIRLLSHTKIPILSPYQGVYAFAEGFSLKAIDLSCEKMALMAVSFDIAKQIGGKDFIKIQKEISQHFNPPSFENCNFNVNKADFTSEDSLPLNILDCIESRVPAHIYLRNTEKVPYVYILRLLSIWNKLYVVTSLHYWRRIEYYSLDNIGYIVPSNTKTIFRTPFIEWSVWKKAHQWVEDLK